MASVSQIINQLATVNHPMNKSHSVSGTDLIETFYTSVEQTGDDTYTFKRQLKAYLFHI